MDVKMYRIFFEAQKKHWWFQTKKKIVLDMIDRYLRLRREDKILDVGCGSGLMLESLSKLGDAYGMDSSNDAIRFSKELFGGEVRYGSLPDSLPFDRNTFALITALDVIEHVDNDVDALRALHSLIAANGKMVLTVPAYMFLWTKFDDVNEHKRRYTLTELRCKLEQSGFFIEKISYYNTLLFPIACLIRFFNKIIGSDGSSDAALPNKFLNKALKTVFGFERRLLKRINFSFGVSIIAVVRPC